MARGVSPCVLIKISVLLAGCGVLAAKYSGQESGQLVLRVLGLPIVPSGWVPLRDSVFRERRSATAASASLLVDARARPKLCSGRRLDSAGPYGPHSAIAASQCAAMGGDCCNLSPAWGYASNDPKRMGPDDACHGCYDSRIRVECSGRVLKAPNKRPHQSAASQETTDDDGSLTAGACSRSGGKCCDPFLQDTVDLHGNATAFDPAGESTDSDASCVNCFDGSPRETGAWTALGTNRLECTGRLVDSEEFTADTCLLLDGHCCDGIYGPYDPIDYPRRDCQTCHSGTIQIYRP